MQNRSRQSLILALALLVGQWLVLAHGWEHPALTPDVDCQIHLHAPNLLSGAPAAGGIVLQLPAIRLAPALPAVAATDSRVAAQPRIRGPPFILA